MCACFRRHVPDDADVALIEYAVNDDEHKAPAFNNNARCGAAAPLSCVQALAVRRRRERAERHAPRPPRRRAQAAAGAAHPQAAGDAAPPRGGAPQRVRLVQRRAARGARAAPVSEFLPYPCVCQPPPSQHTPQPTRHTPPPHAMGAPQGIFWSGSAEREYAELAWYYGLPTLSVKAACYHAMAAGARGFEVDATRDGDEAGRKGRAYYYDWIHPDGLTGHRCLG